jgi:hypothetical protein
MREVMAAQRKQGNLVLVIVIVLVIASSDHD